MRYLLFILLLLSNNIIAQIQIEQLDLTAFDARVLTDFAGVSLTTGTTGTDFNITRTGADATFNLPVASATNTGKLSSTDWTTFNGKFTLPTLTAGSVLFSNGTTIAQDNANLFWENTNKQLRALGGLIYKTARVTTAGYTVAASDYILHFVAGASGTVTIPSAASSTGRTLVLSNHAGVALTVSSAYRTASAATTTTVANNAEVTIVSDGTEWVLISN